MTEPRVYRASGLGYSLCSIVCPFLGYEPLPTPDWLQEKFNEGKEIEPRAIQKLRDDGWVIEDQQEELNAVGDYQIEVDIEIIPGQAIVRGHLDGWVLDGGGLQDVVLEVKSMNAKTWKEFAEKGWETPGIVQKYKWQASCYGLAKQAPVVLAAWNKETEEFAFATMVEPFYSIADLALKVSQAETHIREGTIPEGCTDYPCPFVHLHPSDSLPPEPADKDMDGLLSAWLEADKQVKAFEKEKATLREMIVEMAGSEIAGKIKGTQGVTVSTVWQEESEWVTKRKAGWVTKVSGPRKGRNVTE